MKRTALKPDPEKVRAWIQRSRENARERASERSVSWQAQRQPRRSRVEFRPKVSAKQFMCERCRKSRAVHWHHWLPQESIRVYVRSLRLPDDAADGMLRRLLHDRRNISALCLRCHGNTGTVGHGMRRKDVRPDAFEFAAELGPEWLTRLERSYPNS